MYIYKNDGYPSNDLPETLTYYQEDGRRATVIPPYTAEQLILAGYQIAEDPPEVPDNYRLEWIGKKWVLTSTIPYEHPNPVLDLPNYKGPLVF